MDFPLLSMELDIPVVLQEGKLEEGIQKRIIAGKNFIAAFNDHFIMISHSKESHHI